MKKIDFIEVGGLAAQTETTKIWFKINEMIEVLNELVEKQEYKAECGHVYSLTVDKKGNITGTHVNKFCPLCGEKLL